MIQAVVYFFSTEAEYALQFFLLPDFIYLFIITITFRINGVDIVP